MIKWFDSFARANGIDPRLLFSIPNGSVLAGDATRRAIQMGKLKREGLRPGVPDLMLAAPKLFTPITDPPTSQRITLFHGMLIEMKRRGQNVKRGSDQAQMIELLRLAGYNVVVCQGADEAIRAITAYLA